MYSEKDGSLAFVYRHPKYHRLVRDEISSYFISEFLGLLQTCSLLDALDDSDGCNRQQDWRGRSPSFWPEWREASRNSPANSNFIIRQKMIDPEYAAVREL